MRPARLATWGAAGAQQLSSEPTDDGDAGRGTARSSPFVAESGTVLALLLAGQREPGVALRLCRGTEVVASFFPRLPDRFEPVICPLDAWTGESLHLELHDGGPGWLGVDHVFLARRAADAPDPESTAWAPNPSLAALVQATPLPIVGGRAGAGPMTITVANPLPCAVRLQVALDGPAGTSLLRGDWRRPDGAATPGEAPAGTTVCLPAYLSVPDGFDPRREPVFVILHCSPTLRGAGSPVRIDVPVAWR
jgi:hypothetical protein